MKLSPPAEGNRLRNEKLQHPACVFFTDNDYHISARCITYQIPYIKSFVQGCLLKLGNSASSPLPLSRHYRPLSVGDLYPD